MLALQGMTDCVDKPQLVVPDSSKLDVSRLLLDIPKYKAWVSPSAWKDWEAFIQDIDKLSLVPEIAWKIDKIIATAITSSAARSAKTSHVNEDLLQILAKRNTVPAKVRIYSKIAFTLPPEKKAIMGMLYSIESTH